MSTWARIASITGPTFVSPDGNWKFAFHGLVGSSFYVQDTPQYVLNGQGPLLPLGKADSSFTTGADVRQSRFNFSLAGPKVLDATPKAVVEFDFFGLNSPGGYGQVSVYPRLRLAYAELNWNSGENVLRFGQDHELILALIPDSIGHLAYIVTYFCGAIGWREPGIGYTHTFKFDDSSKLELAVQVLTSSWQNPTDFGESTVQDLNVDLGQLSGLPAGELRVKYSNPWIMAFIAGHYGRVGGTEAGNNLIAPGAAGGSILGAVPTRDWDVLAGVAGLKLSFVGFTLQGSGYVGKNLGPLLGEQLQFVTSNDVHEYGAWGQLGYAIAPWLSISVVGGSSQLETADVEAGGGGRLNNSVIGGMVKFQQGGFAIAPEFYHNIAQSITATGANTEADVNQFLLTGEFFFVFALEIREAFCSLNLGSG